MGESLSSAGGGEEQRFRPSASPAEVERLRQYLVDALQRGATDIHLRAGDAVYARVEGKLTALDTPVLTAVSTFEMVTHILGTSVNAPNIDSVRDYSGPWSAPGVARFRVSILRQRSSFAIVMRVVPTTVPTPRGFAGLPRRSARPCSAALASCS